VGNKRAVRNVGGIKKERRSHIEQEVCMMVQKKAGQHKESQGEQV
jgi:hypothetical protein